jgi:hypothetical protein
MDVDPVTGILYYLGYDPAAGATLGFEIDPSTGAATAIGPVADTPVSAFALSHVSATVFADGFESR